MVRLVGAIGDDFLARVALTELEAGGVDLTRVARLAGTTGLAIITVDEAGENAIVRVARRQRPRERRRRFRRTPFGQATRCSCRWRCRSPRASPRRAWRGRPAPGHPLARAVYAARRRGHRAVRHSIVNEHEAADLARHLGISGTGAEATVDGAGPPASAAP